MARSLPDELADPLPPDLPRLEVLETHLRLQLDAVRLRIAQLRREASGWRTSPAESYRIEHVQVPYGLPGRGIAHRDDCPTQPGTAGESGGVTPRAARYALEDVATPVTPCDVCRPHEELMPEKRHRENRSTPSPYSS